MEANKIMMMTVPSNAKMARISQIDIFIVYIHPLAASRFREKVLYPVSIYYFRQLSRKIHHRMRFSAFYTIIEG